MNKRTRVPLSLLFLVSVLELVTPARAATASWATLTSSTGANPGTVLGNITIGGQTANVTYTGEIAFTQLANAGYNYYTPSSAYGPSTAYTGGPSTSDMIAISGTTDTHSFAFSTPITDPLMAIVSLGGPGNGVSYNFSAPFTILSQGAENPYGGCSTCLSGSGTNTLTGTEGDGIIQFTGNFTSLSWTVTGGEYWNGFTVGASGLPATSEVPEPASWGLSAISLAAVAGIAGRKRLHTLS